MSRSYKHTPYAGQSNSRGMKRIANHKVRQALKNHDLMLSPADYKKLFCSYDICDYYTIAPTNFEVYYKEQLGWWHKRRGWGFKEPYPTRKRCWEEYQKWYRRK